VKRRRLFALIAVLGLLAIAIGFVYLRPRELIYQGKRISVWIADLGSNDVGLINQAANVLVELGEPATPHLISAVEKTESRFHSWYWKFWSSGKLPEFVHRPLPVPISHVHQVRLNSVLVLSRMGAKAKRAVPVLVQALKEQDLGMRMAAAEALGRIGPAAQPAIPALVNMLKEYENSERTVATYALIQIGDPAGKAIESLTTLLNDKNIETRISAAVALWLLEGKSQPTLELLKKNDGQEDWRYRFFSAYTLGEFGSAAKEAVPALLHLLHDEHEAVREHAAKALMRIDPAAAQKAGVK